ncbi:uncharacterized protein H6S33_005579 [Morchella sextelata]|uniref:uncharacterized protein n=1 Tax=Morchella sextelata TaxID=1174677 RepID=UPI001D04A6BC|nr:uncharacterized protein H6S33_005579 [Morchella sextelata]KAH0613693.1 hypothetical protein H6S33_005579 [Morchella sextelata]
MSKTTFSKIGIVGAGSMGSNMALLFADHDFHVSIFDVNSSNIDDALPHLKKQKNSQKISGYKDYDKFVSSLGGNNEPRLFLFSITHGSPADEVLKSLSPHLKKGDIILDGGNEWYLNSERRQREIKEKGVGYICMGVSGGYQSARRGPSISPGGDEDVLEKVMPVLEKVAAQWKGKPCVTSIGPGGSGHYVKMVHNGIEQGMLGVLNEAWELLFKCLSTDLDELAKIFEGWNEAGELKNTFLVRIGAEICARKKPTGTGHLLNDIQDKVVQDADNSEGTGVWTVQEAALRHVSAPTITSAHFYRIASAARGERLQFFDMIGSAAAAKKQHLEKNEERAEFIEDLREAVYCAFLASYCQGMNLIARASKDEGWGVKLKECIRIWRAGCIIESEHIADLLEGVFEKDKGIMNVLLAEKIASEIQRTMPALKKVVMRATEWDAHIPSMSASLEYFKYCAGKHLPAMFMEAQLDYFGAHSYDLKSEGAGEVKKGTHHTEWQPA